MARSTKPKRTKVIVRNLGREKAAGLAHPDDNEIHIDPRQDAKELMDTLIHEKMHLIFPKLSEKAVARSASQLADFLWGIGFRLTHLK